MVVDKNKTPSNNVAPSNESPVQDIETGGANPQHITGRGSFSGAGNAGFLQSKTCKIVTGFLGLAGMVTGAAWVAGSMRGPTDGVKDRWQPDAQSISNWEYALGYIPNPQDPRFQQDNMMVVVDLFDTPQQVIDDLHANNNAVVCYFSAGTCEPWRADWASQSVFVQDGRPCEGDNPLFANKMQDWDERWLNLNAWNHQLTTLMTNRIELAAEKNCDGIEADNVDAWSNTEEVGVTVSKQTEIEYITMLSNTARVNGLAFGLKNNPNIIAELAGISDFAINEQCQQYNECHEYGNFMTKENKPVVGVEYEGKLNTICESAEKSGIVTIKKNYDLSEYRAGCVKP